MANSFFNAKPIEEFKQATAQNHEEYQAELDAKAQQAVNQELPQPRNVLGYSADSVAGHIAQLNTIGPLDPFGNYPDLAWVAAATARAIINPRLGPKLALAFLQRIVDHCENIEAPTPEKFMKVALDKALDGNPRDGVTSFSSSGEEVDELSPETT